MERKQEWVGVVTGTMGKREERNWMAAPLWSMCHQAQGGWKPDRPQAAPLFGNPFTTHKPSQPTHLCSHLEQRLAAQTARLLAHRGVCDAGRPGDGGVADHQAVHALCQHHSGNVCRGRKGAWSAGDAGETRPATFRL